MNFRAEAVKWSTRLIHWCFAALTVAIVTWTLLVLRDGGPAEAVLSGLVFIPTVIWYHLMGVGLIAVGLLLVWERLGAVLDPESPIAAVVFGGLAWPLYHFLYLWVAFGFRMPGLAVSDLDAVFLPPAIVAGAAAGYLSHSALPIISLRWWVVVASSAAFAVAAMYAAAPELM